MTNSDGTRPADNGLSILPPAKTPRTARFAEATAVYSPASPTTPQHFKFPISKTKHYKPQFQVSDIVLDASIDQTVEMDDTDRVSRRPYSPPMTALLRSALKTPGTSKPLFSPTFHEEEALDKAETRTDKDQVRDLRVKSRVRIAKILLRGVNFSCSLIVMSMLLAVFAIFRATDKLPARFVGSNRLNPWNPGQETWPQVAVLVIACLSFVISIAIMIAYCKGGHRRAKKAGIYYTVFSMGVFTFSIVMWLIGTIVLQASRDNGNSKDLWGWSCTDNDRSKVFQEEINFALVCQLQSWSLVCCIIEVVVEVLSLAVYGVTLHRFWTKRKLHKSLASRDRARSDLYLAQLRSQSAPNTPGWTAKSVAAASVTEIPCPDPAPDPDAKPQYARADGFASYAKGAADAFVLQPAPRPFVAPVALQTRLEQDTEDGGREVPRVVVERVASPELRQDHVEAAPGEVVYGAVPIPGAYAEHHY